jgi:hypothetical protein
MSNTTNPNNAVPPSYSPEQIHEMFQAMQERIHQLETAATDAVTRPNKVVARNGKDILLLYPELVENYPAITQQKFYDTVLKPEEHPIIWEDFYHTEGMAYTPPPSLQHTSDLKLPDLSKKHESDLIKIQGYMASSTRLLDTFADEIVDSDDLDTDLGKRVVQFLNSFRIIVSNDASRISKMRRKIYDDPLGLKEEVHREDALLPTATIADRKAQQEIVNKTFRKAHRENGSKPKEGTKKPTYQSRDRKPDRKSDSSADREKKSDTQERRGSDRSYKPRKSNFRSKARTDRESGSDTGNDNEKSRK